MRYGFARPAGTLPAHDGRAPGEAGAEAGHDDELARLEAPFLDRFIQGQGHRAGRRVAVTLQVVEHSAARNVQYVDTRVDDADVGLMRDVKMNVHGLQAAVLEDVLDGVAEDFDGPAEDGPAVH